MTAPDLDPDLLKAFLAVAEHRSFTRAAAMLNRTQSAVSVQIRRLEERLGTKLFHRTRAGVAPTSAGEELRGYAARILALSDEAVGALRERSIEGVVRLGVMDDYGTIVIPPLLASFAKSHPQIRVEIETGLTATMPARLGETYDLVIAMHPQGRGGGELLRREQAVWAAAASYPTKAQDPLPVALYPPGCLFRQWAAEALDAAGRPWRLAFVSRTLAAVEAIAAEGLAVTVVKAGTLPALLHPLCERDGLPPLPAADIRLHRARNLSRGGTLLADHLQWKISESTTIC
ncbi:LysR family transcriptional regulator [Bradyrhizobium centrolobii]|uniref:LysR family transcriptional regulator n=1 Tax=Bradyrhizobium centrolobii TaxID=1505087 RepID=A0A176YQV9_9BRAD|nr:LysR family transcriptional regulator [Bradyrhizobium centrolobii]OAF10004.1 LysR family transcriptional regulator [Bradyrhizobium centrolobii]